MLWQKNAPHTFCRPKPQGVVGWASISVLHHQACEQDSKTALVQVVAGLQNSVDPVAGQSQRVNESRSLEAPETL